MPVAVKPVSVFRDRIRRFDADAVPAHPRIAAFAPDGADDVIGRWVGASVVGHAFAGVAEARPRLVVLLARVSTVTRHVLLVLEAGACDRAHALVAFRVCAGDGALLVLGAIGALGQRRLRLCGPDARDRRQRRRRFDAF